jgi:hypothetical protein
MVLPRVHKDRINETNADHTCPVVQSIWKTNESTIATPGNRTDGREDQQRASSIYSSSAARETANGH